MKLSPEFIKGMKAIPTNEYIQLLRQTNRPHFATRWAIKNEIRPVDIYCYLIARYGSPNGIQNFLRGDHSSNLIHWEWVLQSEDRTILIQGQNFRTEIFISGDFIDVSEKETTINQLKEHFAEYGSKMGSIRKKLEHWIEFVNPYQRIRRSISQLMNDIEQLNLKGKKDSIKEISICPETSTKHLNEIAERYNRAIGLSFGVRSMLPVLAESFVNLLLYILMKPELKSNERLRDNIFRQPIDIRISSFSNNCNGFKKHIDYKSEPCRKYHKLVNERNDLLHGNVVVDKLKFNDLYFSGNIPIFKGYSTMWERSYGVSLRAVGFDTINDKLETVNNLIEYLLSCINDDLQDQVRFIAEKYDIGERTDTGRLGVLFDEHLVDFAIEGKYDLDR
jgi:hypothetical protein